MSLSEAELLSPWKLKKPFPTLPAARVWAHDHRHGP